MNPATFRIVSLLVVAVSPLAARVVYRMNFAREGEPKRWRFIFIAFLVAIACYCVHLDLYSLNMSNSDFAAFLLFAYFFSLIAYAACLKNRQADVSNELNDAKSKLIMIVLALSCFVACVPLMVARGIDEDLVEQKITRTSAPEIAFVPSMIEIVRIDDREYFQIRSENTNLTDAYHRTVLFNVDRSPQNDSLLMPIRKQLGSGETQRVLTLSPARKEMRNGFLVYANAVSAPDIF